MEIDYFKRVDLKALNYEGLTHNEPQWTGSAASS